MSAKRQQPTDEVEDTLGLEGAARMMRLGLEAMKELVDKGDVPAVRLNQKHTVMLREDLIDFLRSEGRRQAEERKKTAIGSQTAANSGAPPRTKHRGRKLRITPPDLRAYENK